LAVWELGTEHHGEVSGWSFGAVAPRMHGASLYDEIAGLQMHFNTFG
jgi:hypothetical protein